MTGEEAVELAVQLMRDPNTPAEIRSHIGFALMDIAKSEDPEGTQRKERKIAMKYGAELLQIQAKLQGKQGDEG